MRHESERAGFERFVLRADRNGPARPMRTVIDNGPAHHAKLELAISEQAVVVRVPHGTMAVTSLQPIDASRFGDMRPERVPRGTLETRSWYLEVLDSKGRWITAKTQPETETEARAFAARFSERFRVLKQRGGKWVAA